MTYDEAGQQMTWVGRTWKRVRTSVQSASQAPVDIDVSGERKHLRARVKGRDTRLAISAMTKCKKLKQGGDEKYVGHTGHKNR